MDDTELAFTPAWRQKELIASKAVSPLELTELYLRRIESLDPHLNTYLTVVADKAIECAKEAGAAVQRGDDLGLLHGVPISIKDLNKTMGIRTTLGSMVFKDWVPDEDDIVVARIRKSGAVILGKTNTPEFGHIGTCENFLGDPCRNPWDVMRTPAGSSGGAASGLAAGLCAIAQGSDGGGSIRSPASFCGVYGLKPTQGRVPRDATGPGGWGQIAQDGPISRTVRDAAILLQVIAGPDPRDPFCIRSPLPDFSTSLEGAVRGLRIGWTPNFGSTPVDPEIRLIAERAVMLFEQLGATVEIADVHIDTTQARELLNTIAWIDDFVEAERLLTNHPDKLWPTFRQILEEVMTWHPGKMMLALRELEWHRYHMTQLFEKYDLLMNPTMAVAAHLIGEPPETIDGKKVSPLWGKNPFNFLTNMGGQPAASVPCGFTHDGAPVGLHIAGGIGHDGMVLMASAAFEKAQPWADKHPPVS